MHQFLRLKLLLWVAGGCLLLTAPAVALADDLSPALREVIDMRFPGATINKVEQEIWKGEQVTEVELTDESGIEYEVYLSSDGEIVRIVLED